MKSQHSKRYVVISTENCGKSLERVSKKTKRQFLTKIPHIPKYGKISKSKI